jgi:hypothetical protein
MKRGLRRSFVDELHDARHDLGAEAAAVEHAVVACAFLQMMALAGFGNVAAQVVGGFGLADAGNVVVFAFHRHQRRSGDRGRIDRFAAMGERAVRQGVADEHLLDRLQIVFRRQIEDREELVVELPVLFGRLVVVVHQMPVHLAVGIHVAVEVHGGEAGELQEARIDIAAVAGLGNGTRTMAWRLSQSRPRLSAIR